MDANIYKIVTNDAQEKVVHERIIGSKELVKMLHLSQSTISRLVRTGKWSKTYPYKAIKIGSIPSTKDVITYKKAKKQEEFELGSGKEGASKEVIREAPKGQLPCRTCIYRVQTDTTTQGHCNYIGVMGHSRGCPWGYGCTEYVRGPAKKTKVAATVTKGRAIKRRPKQII